MYLDASLLPCLVEPVCAWTHLLVTVRIPDVNVSLPHSFSWQTFYEYLEVPGCKLAIYKQIRLFVSRFGQYDGHVSTINICYIDRSQIPRRTLSEYQTELPTLPGGGDARTAVGPEAKSWRVNENLRLCLRPSENDSFWSADISSHKFHRPFIFQVHQRSQLKFKMGRTYLCDK